MACVAAPRACPAAKQHAHAAYVPSMRVAGVGCRTARRSAPGTSDPQNRLVTKAVDQQDRIATQTIDDLDTNYCNDFECQSSPAIEQTVRSLARALQRLKLDPGLFQRDATYQDGFRSFKGADKLSKAQWWSTAVTKPNVTITKMRMLDKGTAQINWRVVGSAGGGAVDIAVTTTVSMNQLTGRVATYSEQWDLSRVAPPMAASLTATRMLWSLKAASNDVGENMNKAVNDTLSSMDGDEGASSNNYNANPNDPTRFFLGGNNGQDQQFNDAVTFAALAALLYAIFKAYEALEGL